MSFMYAWPAGRGRRSVRDASHHRERTAAGSSSGARRPKEALKSQNNGAGSGSGAKFDPEDSLSGSHQSQGFGVHHQPQLLHQHQHQQHHHHSHQPHQVSQSSYLSQAQRSHPDLDPAGKSSPSTRHDVPTSGSRQSRPLGGPAMQIKDGILCLPYQLDTPASLLPFLQNESTEEQAGSFQNNEAKVESKAEVQSQTSTTTQPGIVTPAASSQEGPPSEDARERAKAEVAGVTSSSSEAARPNPKSRRMSLMSSSASHERSPSVRSSALSSSRYSVEEHASQWQQHAVDPQTRTDLQNSSYSSGHQAWSQFSPPQAQPSLAGSMTLPAAQAPPLEPDVDFSGSGPMLPYRAPVELSHENLPEHYHYQHQHQHQHQQLPAAHHPHHPEPLQPQARRPWFPGSAFGQARTPERRYSAYAFPGPIQGMPYIPGQFQRNSMGPESYPMGERHERWSGNSGLSYGPSVGNEAIGLLDRISTLLPSLHQLLDQHTQAGGLPGLVPSDRGQVPRYRQQHPQLWDSRRPASRGSEYSHMAPDSPVDTMHHYSHHSAPRRGSEQFRRGRKELELQMEMEKRRNAEEAIQSASDNSPYDYQKMKNSIYKEKTSHKKKPMDNISHHEMQEIAGHKNIIGGSNPSQSVVVCSLQRRVEELWNLYIEEKDKMEAKWRDEDDASSDEEDDDADEDEEAVPHEEIPDRKVSTKIGNPDLRGSRDQQIASNKPAVSLPTSKQAQRRTLDEHWKERQLDAVREWETKHEVAVLEACWETYRLEREQRERNAVESLQQENQQLREELAALEAHWSLEDRRRSEARKRLKSMAARLGMEHRNLHKAIERLEEYQPSQDSDNSE